MKAYYILSSMIIILIVLFAVLPKFLKIQNQKMEIERKYHQALKKAIDQNLDIEVLKNELSSVLPIYFKNLNKEEQNSRIESDMTLLRKQG